MENSEVPTEPEVLPSIDEELDGSPRRMHFGRAALIGVAAGLLAVGFRQTLAWAEGRRENLLSQLHLHPYWGWMILPVIGLAVGCLVGRVVTRLSPEASGSGIPHLKGVLLHLRQLLPWRLIPIKFLGGVLSIGSGLSLGREGPTVQMGAAVAKALSGLLRTPKRDLPQLLSAGAGAGLAAAFNAPLAGLMFVIEELHRELSSRTATGAMIAAVCATVITQAMAGDTPSFEIYGLSALPLRFLPLAALMGLIAGAGGVLFNKCLLFGQRAAHTQPWVPRWMLPGLAGALVGLIAWWVPNAVGGGHSVAERVLGGTFIASAGMLATLLVLKLALTTISYASGAPGGIFAPMLLLGALTGATVAKAGSVYWPVMSAHAQVLAVLGMAGFFAGSVRAPMTGVILVSEMTGGYELLFPICITVLVAYLIGEACRDKPIYEALLETDLERTGHGTPSQEPRTIYLGIQSSAPLAGKRIAEANLPRGCLVVQLERSGHILMPTASTVLRPGDHISILMPGDTPEMAMELVRLCTGL